MFSVFVCLCFSASLLSAYAGSYVQLYLQRSLSILVVFWPLANLTIQLAWFAIQLLGKSPRLTAPWGVGGVGGVNGEKKWSRRRMRWDLLMAHSMKKAARKGFPLQARAGQAVPDLPPPPPLGPLTPRICGARPR